MDLPSPQHPLDDACSVLYNNTLFSYSSEGYLQSLDLQKGAKWGELPMGVPVKGGVCVKTTPQNNTDASALWIVGGSAANSNYTGLQRFTFADGQWETINSDPLITKNRLYHNAVYLNASDSILVYAGTQDGTMQPSTQTFTIQASEPYTVLAFRSMAPPAISPLLMPWTDSQALMVYGSEAMVFDPASSWFSSGANLSEPLQNTSTIKSVLIHGDDASKTLYTFDMEVSPNVVNRTALVDGNGNPIMNSRPIVSRALTGSPEWEERSNRVERDLTLGDWPAYNGTLVPTSTRTSSSLAEGENGLVVISGGNPQDVLCMFQARENRWVNATAVLVSESSTHHGLNTATTSSASTASKVASPSQSAAGAAPHHFPTKILVAVLVSIIGAAFILLLAVLILRVRRRRKQFSEAGHLRRASGIPSDEKDSLEFADRGLPQMISGRQFLGHAPQTSQGSYSSMSILMGRVAGHKRGNDKGDGSEASSQFNSKYKAEISKPILQESSFGGLPLPAGDMKATPSVVVEDQSTPDRDLPPPRPRYSRGGRGGSRRTSSGWDRYWSGSVSTMNILGFGSKRTTYNEGSDRDSGSLYSEQRHPSQLTQTSATVPPLRIPGQPELNLNRVVTGSPTMAHTSRKFPLRSAMSGQIERSDSVISHSSYGDDDQRDAYSSGVPESVHEQTSWTPVDGPRWDERVPSNTHTEGAHATPLPRSTVGDFPGDFPMDTPFPVPPSTRPPAPTSSDMSWLNLGGNSKD